MIFQLGTTQYVGGGQLQNVVRVLEQWGFVDAFLPFILIFVLIFALLNRVNLFKQGEGGKRGPDASRINSAIAFAISLMVVIPHILGRYTAQYDPINIINTILPGAAVILVVVMMALILIGMVSKEDKMPNWISQIVGLLALLILGIIIVATVWPTIAPFTFLNDPSLQALVVVLLVMGLTVWFVTRSDAQPTNPQDKKSLKETFKELFE